MQFKTYASIIFLAVCLQSAYAQIPPWAGEPNILGLPAVPQNQIVGAAGAAGGAAGKAGAAIATNAANLVARAAISGEMGITHGVQNGEGRIVYTTRATFDTPIRRSEALSTARLVQTEFASKSCIKPCFPGKMSAPEILSDGRLQFDLVIKPLYKHLDQNQFGAALQGLPINLRSDQIATPAPAPAVSAEVVTK